MPRKKPKELKEPQSQKLTAIVQSQSKKTRYKIQCKLRLIVIV